MKKLILALMVLMVVPLGSSGSEIKKVALRSDTGKYLGRCNNCIPGAAYSDSAFVHVGNLSSAPFAQWDLIRLN